MVMIQSSEIAVLLTMVFLQGLRMGSFFCKNKYISRRRYYRWTLLKGISPKLPLVTHISKIISEYNRNKQLNKSSVQINNKNSICEMIKDIMSCKMYQ